jgi:hypothetical protein
MVASATRLLTTPEPPEPTDSEIRAAFARAERYPQPRETNGVNSIDGAAVCGHPQPAGVLTPECDRVPVAWVVRMDTDAESEVA